MPQLPAICENCQAVFPSGFNLRGRNLTMVGCTSICPRCGGSGKILDGVYSALEDALHVVLQEPNRELVERLLSVLKEGKERQKPRDQIHADILKTDPKLQSLADCLPRTRDQLYAVIAIIVATLALVIHQFGDKPSQHQITQYIDNSVDIIYRNGSGE